MSRKFMIEDTFDLLHGQQFLWVLLERALQDLGGGASADWFMVSRKGYLACKRGILNELRGCLSWAPLGTI